MHDFMFNADVWLADWMELVYSCSFKLVGQGV